VDVCRFLAHHSQFSRRMEMKTAKLLLALAGLFLVIGLLVLPQMIEAKRMRSTSTPAQGQGQGQSEVIVGESFHNDTSPPLRDMKQLPINRKTEREANENPRIPHVHKDGKDPVIQRKFGGATDAPVANMPGTLNNFDGIPFPGVNCNCAPPDTDGEVGATQYVQIVNEGLQVFNKSTGASVLGPIGIATIWSGFGGVCQNNGNGDQIRSKSSQ